MTTIRIQKTEIDDKNIVILEVVSIDNDNFFHVHGLVDGKRIDHRVYFDECLRPSGIAQNYYDYHHNILHIKALKNEKL